MRMSLVRRCAGGVLVVFLAAVGLSGASADLPEMEHLPTAEPETVGMSSERLERLDRVMQDYIDRNEVAGVVTLVARRGKVVHFSATGQRDVEHGGTDDTRHHLPHGVDDQADRLGGVDDAV